jgi:Domain of unknown function (DUF1840)
MLVRFRSDGGDMTMFGDVALTLIKLMGHSGTVPSAILAKDLPAALANLRKGVASAPSAPPPAPVDDPDLAETPVSLHQRAVPLIELLERCIKNRYDLLWEQQR